MAGEMTNQFAAGRLFSLRRLLRWWLVPEMESLRCQVRHLGEQLKETQIETRSWRRALVPTEVHEFLDKHHHVHLSGGGLGDAWLSVAMLRSQGQPPLVFAAEPSVKHLIKEVFRLFNFPTLLIPPFFGSATGLLTFQHVWEHPHCQGHTHLPPGLDYDDWARNADRYVSQLVTWLPVREKFGLSANPRPTKKLYALAPRGSTTCRSFERKRLSVEEYRALVGNLLARDATVISIGSETDLAFYSLYPHPNHIWHAADWKVSYPSLKEASCFTSLLALINTCDEVISVDTWVKTYSALAAVPTTVIATRFDEPYQNPGDHLFLNPVWGFRKVGIEQLLQETAQTS